MHFRSFISFLILMAFAAGASWALGELVEDVKLSSSMILGVVTVTMVSCGFAWHWLKRAR